jgi:hypothetical protein
LQGGRLGKEGNAVGPERRDEAKRSNSEETEQEQGNGRVEGLFLVAPRCRWQALRGEEEEEDDEEKKKKEE